MLAKERLFQAARRLHAFRDSHFYGSTSKQASGARIFLVDASPHLDDSIDGMYIYGKILNNVKMVSSKTKVWNSPRLGGASFENSWFNFRNVSRTLWLSLLARFAGTKRASSTRAFIVKWGIKCADFIQQSRKSKSFISFSLHYFSQTPKLYYIQNYSVNVMI